MWKRGLLTYEMPHSFMFQRCSQHLELRCLCGFAPEHLRAILQRLDPLRHDEEAEIGTKHVFYTLSFLHSCNTGFIVEPKQIVRQPDRRGIMTPVSVHSVSRQRPSPLGFGPVAGGFRSWLCWAAFVHMDPTAYGTVAATVIITLTKLLLLLILL